MSSFPRSIPIRMAQNDSTLSLDEWKEYFCHAKADIFEVIKGAILVAASECPNEFKSRRGEIIENLYMSHPSIYRAEAETMNRAVDDRESTTVRAKDIKGTDSANVELAPCDESRTQPAQDKLNYSESASLDESKIVGEVVRIKRVLTNWKSKSRTKICKSLKQLKLLKLSAKTFSVRIDKVIEIGKAVNELQKHKSGRIRKVARELIE